MFLHFPFKVNKWTGHFGPFLSLQKSKELPIGSQVLAADKSLERKQQHQQPLHQLQQQQQQQQREQQQPVRWREKEAELQHRLTEREREIGRLKEKLRDLTKKLREQEDTKVKFRRKPEYFLNPADEMFQM